MKAILEFSLPEDEYQHRLAVHSGDMASAITVLMQETRAWLKYGHSFKSPDEAIEAVRGIMANIHNITTECSI